MSSVLCYDVLGSCRGRLRHGHYRCFDEVHLHRDVTAHRRVADAHVLRDLSIKNRTFYPTFLIVSLQNIKPIVFLSYSSQAFWGLLMFCTAEKFGVEMSTYKSQWTRGVLEVQKGHFRFRPSFTKCKMAAKRIFLSKKEICRILAG